MILPPIDIRLCLLQNCCGLVNEINFDILHGFIQLWPYSPGDPRRARLLHGLRHHRDPAVPLRVGRHWRCTGHHYQQDDPAIQDGHPAPAPQIQCHCSKEEVRIL